jgi:hypothetical protein
MRKMVNNLFIIFHVYVLELYNTYFFIFCYVSMHTKDMNLIWTGIEDTGNY